MKYVSLFSGIEAATVAWEPLGWKPLAFAEIDPFASAVLAHRYPDVPNLGDVTAVDWSAWRRADLLVGGPPCQAFSIAGLRNSLDDDRGNLSLEYVKAIHAIDPTWTVTENVPGWLSTSDNAFGCFLAGLVGEDAPLVPPGGRWTDAGVVVGPERAAAWRILDAQYMGVAQRRRRVFVVSCRTRDGINPGAVLLEPESLPRHHRPRAEERTHPSRASEDPLGSRGLPRVAGSLTASMGRRGGVPDGGDTPGHLIPAVAGTLLNNGKAAGSATTQDAFSGQLIPMPFSPEQITSSHNRSNPQPGDPCPTLTGSSGQPPAVAFQHQASTSQNMVPGPISPTLGTTKTPAVFIDGGVRRLMPVECERLQGFPDGWTLVPYRGKLAKDSPRYKAIGNAMAIPPMRWIGQRIAAVEKWAR